MKSKENEEQDAVLTLYSCRMDINCIPNIVKKLFSDVMKKILFYR